MKFSNQIAVFQTESLHLKPIAKFIQIAILIQSRLGINAPSLQWTDGNW